MSLGGSALRGSDSPDPVKTLQEAETDDELAPLRDAFSRISSTLAQPLRRDSALAVVASISASIGNNEAQARHRESPGDRGMLRCDERYQGGRFWLRSNRDRVAGDWKLRHAGELDTVLLCGG